MCFRYLEHRRLHFEINLHSIFISICKCITYWWGYGYSFLLGKRLNLVPHVGVGIAYGKSYEGYDQMLAPGQGVQAVATPGFKPILTRFGITVTYILN